MGALEVGTVLRTVGGGEARVTTTERRHRIATDDLARAAGRRSSRPAQTQLERATYTTVRVVAVELRQASVPIAPEALPPVLWSEIVLEMRRVLDLPA